MGIKLQGPIGCTSCSHAGITYSANKKGIFVVADEACYDLIKFHGFSTISEIEPETKKKSVETFKDVEIEDIDGNANADIVPINSKDDLIDELLNEVINVKDIEI